MKVLLVGATGKTGKEVLKELLKRDNYVVTAAVRNAQKLKDLNLVGDFNIAEIDLSQDVTDVAKGHDAVIFVAGSGGKNVEEVDYGGLKRVVASAKLHGVKKFLYISSLNIGKEKATILSEIEKYYSQFDDPALQSERDRLLKGSSSDGYAAYLKQKTLAESELVQSGLDYVIFRAGLLTEEAGTYRYHITSGASHEFGKTARQNIALAFVLALDNPLCQGILTLFDGSLGFAEAIEKGTKKSPLE